MIGSWWKLIAAVSMLLVRSPVEVKTSQHKPAGFSFHFRYFQILSDFRGFFEMSSIGLLIFLWHFDHVYTQKKILEDRSKEQALGEHPQYRQQSETGGEIKASESLQWNGTSHVWEPNQPPKRIHFPDERNCLTCCKTGDPRESRRLLLMLVT